MPAAVTSRDGTIRSIAPLGHNDDMRLVITAPWPDTAAIAIGASFAALWLFFQLREGNSWGMRLARIGAAFVMGFAISGMHYTGMAASRFNARSFCTGGASVNTGSLAVTTGVIAFVVLSITTVFLVVEARRDALARRRVARIDAAA